MLEELELEDVLELEELDELVLDELLELEELLVEDAVLPLPPQPVSAAINSGINTAAYPEGFGLPFKLKRNIDACLFCWCGVAPVACLDHPSR